MHILGRYEQLPITARSGHPPVDQGGHSNDRSLPSPALVQVRKNTPAVRRTPATRTPVATTCGTRMATAARSAQHHKVPMGTARPPHECVGNFYTRRLTRTRPIVNLQCLRLF